MHRQDHAQIPLVCDDKILPLCQQKATLLIKNTLHVITKDGFFQEELPLGIENEYEEEQIMWLQT